MKSLFACLLVFLAMQTASAGGHVEKTAAAHAHDKPVATPVATAAPARPVDAGLVEYGGQGDAPLRGYLAKPKGDGITPGLIVIHEWWGLNDNIRAVTERLAGEGYTALAVDLYGGQSAQSPKEAMQLMQSLSSNAKAGNDNLRQAFSYLEETTSGSEIGVVGWCLGGRWALRTAVILPDSIDAAVMYYGTPDASPQELSALTMPILGNFAENDPLIPLDRLRQFEATLRDLEKSVDIKVYAGAEHAFSNPSGTAYNKEAADDAWQRTTAFFKRELQASTDSGN